MANKKENILLILSLLMILAISFAVWFIKTDTSAQILVYSDQPEWDLRELDLSNNYVRTRGDIAEYVTNQLLTPEEFAAAEDVLVGYPINAADVLTTRYRILVEPGQAYAITFYTADFATRIYVNGVLMQQIGQPGTSLDEMIPQTRPTYFTVVADDGVIEVVQQISNFVHRSGGNPTTLYIGSPDSMSLRYNRELNTTSLIMGSCLLLFLVHLTLFFFLPQYRANLYFALFCFTWFLRTSLVGMKVLPTLFPQLSWYFFFRLEYVCIPLAFLLFMLALNATFPGIIAKKALKIAGFALVGIFIVLFIFFDTVWISQAVIYCQAMILVSAAYVAIRFLMQLHKKTMQHFIFFSGLLVLIYALLHDALYYNDIHIFPAGANGFLDFALLVFILFQMAATFAGTMNEVRAAKEAEQKLLMENTMLEQMNSMKSDLIATVSHEMRTPLTVMSVYSQMAVKDLREKDFDSRTTEDLETISQEAQRLADMASRLLTMFGDRYPIEQQAALSITDLLTQVSNLFSPLLEQNGNRLSLIAAPQLPLVYGNSDLLTQMVWNLLINAAEHTHQGLIEIHVQQQGEEIALCISDNGSGIAPDLLPHVFERYISGEKRSGGRGLAICKEIADSLKGRISIESELGKGTKVCVFLPTEKESASHE